jgi:hypothetical protein
MTITLNKPDALQELRTARALGAVLKNGTVLKVGDHTYRVEATKYGNVKLHEMYPRAPWPRWLQKFADWLEIGWKGELQMADLAPV